MAPQVGTAGIELRNDEGFAAGGERTAAEVDRPVAVTGDDHVPCGVGGDSILALIGQLSAIDEGPLSQLPAGGDTVTITVHAAAAHLLAGRDFPTHGP